MISRNFKIYLLIFSILFTGKIALAAVTGFTTPQVELSTTSVIEGEEVEISVSFTNQEDARLTGKISFYDGDILLGSRELTLDSGQSGEYIMTWKATLGEHSFVAKAESLKLAGSTVAVLGPSTEPKEIMIGFKNSGIAEKLREQGGFGTVVAGVLDEVQQFFVPIIQSLDTWRDSKIEPVSNIQDRVDAEKETIEEGKIKPILVVHSIILTIILFVITTKPVFFGLVVFLIFWIFVRIVRLFRRITRKDYSEK